MVKRAAKAPANLVSYQEGMGGKRAVLAGNVGVIEMTRVVGEAAV